MTYDPSGELKRFTRWRTERVLSLAAAGEPDAIHGTLILAIGSRESNLRNIVGGGYFDANNEWVSTGVDRGFVQINEQYHAAWLKSVAGCISGEWAEVYLPDQGGAFPKGRCPGLTSAVKKCIATLRFNRTYAEKQGVDTADLTHVAVAGWNTGIGTAIRNYQQYGDPDRTTTHGNYGKDVLERQKAIRRFLQQKGWG